MTSESGRPPVGRRALSRAHIQLKALRQCALSAPDDISREFVSANAVLGDLQARGLITLAERRNFAREWIEDYVRGCLPPLYRCKNAAAAERSIYLLSQQQRARRTYDLAHEHCVCSFVPIGEEHRRRGGILGCQPFLERISYPAALLVAVVLGFVGAFVALSASEAVTPGPPAAFRVEMAKPPLCSLKTPDRLFFI
jgi:hypothetical protein